MPNKKGRGSNLKRSTKTIANRRTAAAKRAKESEGADGITSNSEELSPRPNPRNQSDNNPRNESDNNGPILAAEEPAEVVAPPVHEFSDDDEDIVAAAEAAEVALERDDVASENGNAELPAAEVGLMPDRERFVRVQADVVERTTTDIESHGVGDVDFGSDVVRRARQFSEEFARKSSVFSCTTCSEICVDAE